MLKDTEQIERVLRALGEKMDYYNCQPLGLVICGGTALLVGGIVSRVTRDVDIVAFCRREGSGLKMAEAPAVLPEDVRKCLAEVAEDFGLKGSWLNTGPRRLIAQGLPEGMEKRLKYIDFGPKLSVWITAREDLVCFKLYAAANFAKREIQHREDVEALKPTDEELERAIAWCLQQSDSENFREKLRRLLCDMDHEDFAYNLGSGFD